jgi:hypothetical protein
MGTVLTAIERAGLPKRMAYSDFAAAPAMISGGAVHLGGNPWQRLHQEVSSSHPGLDRTEGMLDRLAPLAHLLRMLVQPSLHRVENMLMLPPGDASLLAGGAGVLDRKCRRFTRGKYTQRASSWNQREPGAV